MKRDIAAFGAWNMEILKTEEKENSPSSKLTATTTLPDPKTSMSRLLVCLYLIVACSAFGQDKILIYTKNGKGYVHENISASVEALKKLATEHKLVADATDQPSVFTASNLKQYKCIIFSNTNNEGFDTEEQKQAFVDYVHSGGGFVGIHSASGSERQWP